MNILYLVLALIFLHGPLIGSAHGEIIQFADKHYYPNPVYQPGYIYAGAYAQGYSDGFLDTDGFRFYGKHFHTIDAPAIHGISALGGAPNNGTVYLNAEGGHPVRMTSIDGRPFSLIGFDGAESFVNVAVAQQNGYYVASIIRVAGTRLDGTVLSASFQLDGINDGGGVAVDFQPFVLPPEWYNLISVTFSGIYGESTPAGFSLDNINAVPGLVPEPSPVTISNRRLLVNLAPFTVTGVVYSPVPIGDDPNRIEPFGDYFTAGFSAIYTRDLPLLRQMGANTVRVLKWNSMADHRDFLDKAFNEGVNPIYVVAGYWINPGLNIDPDSPGNLRDEIKRDFREMVALHKSHPAILMWSIGNNLNAAGMYGGSPDHLFSLIEEMAAEAHAEEGNGYHPVIAQLADQGLAGTVAARESSVPSLDVWGANVYRGSSFGTLFKDFKAAGTKPLLLLEYGIDAYDNVHKTEYEAIGTAYQADYAVALWKEIAANPDVCAGATIMEYSDAWWKGSLASDKTCMDEDPGYHGECGHLSASDPDGHSNDEWMGMMRVIENGLSPDIMEPRAVYSALQSLWEKPGQSFKINNGAPFTNSTLVTLNLFCADDVWCYQMLFSSDSASWWGPWAYAPACSYRLTTGDGVKTVYGKLRNVQQSWLNTWPGDSLNSSIILDTIVPVTTASPPGGAYASVQAVALACSDGTGSGCDKTYYTADGSTPGSGSSLYQGPITMASPTTLKYFSTDLAGNREAVKTQTYGVDLFPPSGTVAISNGAPFTRSTGVYLNLSCSDNVGCNQMQFSNDNVTWSSPGPYAATKSWSLASGNGLRTVYAKFRDTAGNWSDAVSSSIVADMTAPVSSASPGGGNYAASQTVGLACADGTGSGCDKTYYTTDGSIPTTAASVYSGPITIPSTTVLKYFSTDLAGNQEYVKTQTYSVDTVSPAGTVAINSGAPFTNSTSVTLNLSCSDNIGCYQMLISNDNLSWFSPSPYVPVRSWSMPSGNGLKSVYVKFRDAAGNWSGVASGSILLDTIAPVTGVSPGGGAYLSSQAVALACSDGTGAGCDKTYYTTDGSTPTIVSSVYQAPITIASTTTLKYFSADLVGNQEPVRTQTYSIDTTPPTGTVAINNGVPFTRSSSVNLNLTCSDSGGCTQVQFSNDNATWSSPQLYSATRYWTLTSGNGGKTVYAKFRDTAGNWSSAVSSSVLLDMNAPATAASPAGGTYGASQSVSLACGDGTGSGCDKIYFTTDGSTPTTASNLYQGAITIASTRSLKYFSTDLAGNQESVKTQTYSIDADPPTGTMAINSGAPFTRSGSVILNLSCSDNVGCYQILISNDNVAWSSPSPYAAAKTWSLASGNGVKTVYVKFRDAAGNWSGIASSSILFDLSPPVTAASPAGGAYGASQTVSLACGDGAGAGCDRTYYTTDGSTPTTASTLYQGPIPIASTTALKYFSMDLAGNSETVKTQTYTIDITPPTGVVSIKNGAPYATSTEVTLNLSCSDNIGCSQMRFSNDNVTWAAPGAYATAKTWILTAGNGVKTVYGKFGDAAGNWSGVSSATILYDTNRPVTTASPVGGTYTGPQTVALACGDGTGSGCDKTYYTTDGSTPTTASSVYSGPIPVSASTNVRFFSTDLAGNTELLKSQSYTIR